jgi:DNA mismatch repair protein MLH3
MLRLEVSALTSITYVDAVVWRMMDMVFLLASLRSMGIWGPCTVSSPSFKVMATLTLASGTSKHNPSTDTYGSHGCFISSLSALSLLSITSRHRAEADADEWTVSFNQSQVLARFRTFQEHQRILRKIHGTKVTVRDLFGKLPVRVKHRAVRYGFQENLDKEFEDLKRKIVTLLLAWSRPVKITLSDTDKKRKCLLRLNQESLSRHEWDSSTDGEAKLPFRLNCICPLLAQAGYISHSSFTSWLTASAQTSTTCIRAAISLEPAPTKQVQFISFGIRPVDPAHGSQILFNEVNRMFAMSSFGVVEDEIDISEDENSRRQNDRRCNSDERTTRRVRGIGKGADRWPMFYIRIDLGSGHHLSDENQAHDKAARVLQKVLQLLKTLIHQFLEDHYFRPQVTRHKKRKEGIGTSHMQNPFTGPVIDTALNEASSQSVPGISSMASMIVQPNVYKSRQHVTSHGFDSWTRVKSGKRDGFEHILSGLPRRKALADDNRPATAPAVSSPNRNPKIDIGRIALAESRQPWLDHNVQLRLQDSQNMRLVNDSEDGKVWNDFRPSVVSTSDAPPMEEETAQRHSSLSKDETILWTTPTSGRVVHINSRTGLIVPGLQDQDKSHDASEEDRSTGPFSGAVLVPERTFDELHRPTPRTLELGLDVAPGSWIADLWKDSETSIFRELEATIPSVAPEETITHGRPACCCHSKSCSGRIKQVSALFDVMTAASEGRLSKSGLADAQVLAQVDRKFILVKLSTCQTGPRNDNGNSQPLLGETVLVLIDQHAADERCQVEALYEELCNVETVQLLKPLHFEVSLQEGRLFQQQRDFLGGWGFCYEMQDGHLDGDLRLASSRSGNRLTSTRLEGNVRVVVTALPNLIAERCRLEPKILINLLRNEIWTRAENGFVKSKDEVSSEGPDFRQCSPESSGGEKKQWLSKISSCPKSLIEMLNSRACRSAIMFNDVLSREKCKALVKRLANCSFPFQCAHGRPSMVALGSLGAWEPGDGQLLDRTTVQDNLEGADDFKNAFDKWQADIGKGSDG